MQFADPCGKGAGMAFLATFGQFLIGLGLLLLGCAALWFVSVYSEKKR